MNAERETYIGLLAALSAFAFWGLAPIYFKFLGGVGADEIIAHRVLWSVVFLGLVLVFRHRGKLFSRLRVSRRVLLTLALSSALILINWLIFVYAVNSGRVLSTSLGYFINPLVNVVLGMIIFRERLTGLQTLAVLIAAAGTGYMAWQVGVVPWMALGLAFSFAMYSVLRKLIEVGPMVGLFWETLIAAPLALGWILLLSSEGRMVFDPSEPGTAALLAGTGLVTVIPLLLFAAGVRRLPLSTMGLLQYLAPSMTFILAVFVYAEPFTSDHAVTFGCIWIALILYTLSSLHRRRRARMPL
ncbi:EamA family transporter RarD [Wenzhouxiangella marina]|uniref:RarD protein, DMT superfamily transporter n=1 Tax=Wenzhouxiangella marina TaxID=1579979 RepID=A0A0K0XY52_9GAMM|nr:EamA family transporter RarD [Wenzhouxiangella marina]AKS42624.1 RarD protein, DMT superfamily transporter [Wenzhouxiangella marina]MBB6085594.1 chloramphenicol-sensitive protein RarD [Wenzhouxiangella marina]